MHIPTKLKKFPYDIINKYIKDIDFIFGLGDYNTQDGLNYLFSYGKEVYAISGNMDEYSISFNLSDNMVVLVEEINVGLIHGWGSRNGLREKISKSFDNVNCYGHSHIAFFGKVNGLYYFNPGSLCEPNSSFGILTVEKKNIKAEIIKIT